MLNVDGILFKFKRMTHYVTDMVILISRTSVSCTSVTADAAQTFGMRVMRYRIDGHRLRHTMQIGIIILYFIHLYAHNYCFTTKL